MPSVCFYFQLHQPLRLRRYSVFDAATDYFDAGGNGEILRKVAQKCYLPTTALLLRLIHEHNGRFRIAFSLTGCVVEQLQEHAPEVLERFGELARTGCCEFLAETYHHSLAFLYSRDEFLAQIDLHGEMIEDLFGQRPRVFRNTELIYNNELARVIADLERYRGILVEGADHVLHDRSPNHLYRPPGGGEGLALLLKNYRLSDDIAFRFSDRSWPHWPLDADRFARWINQLNEQATPAELCNLFMDIETFGEHQWRETGIFDFLAALPDRLLADGNGFKTPGECIEAYEPVDAYDAPQLVSWADTERDCSAWMGNAMQSSALDELYRLEEPVKASGDAALLRDWRMLTTSDHFYYMSTKHFADQDVHQYFNPYDSPYDGYINFMNVLDNLHARVEGQSASSAP